jgi:Protein of unknown function (DUF3501)
MTMKHEITRGDLMPIPEYTKVRKERRQALVAAKRDRRLHVGPYATFHFENYDSMWHQIHEMLYIEKGGEAQVEDELRAYNSLIPNGRELVATIMFEIDDEKQRRAFLAKLGGVEETVFMRFDGETVRGVPEADVDRTSADGKASSVQFIHIPFTPEQIRKFRRPGTEVTLGFGHPAYGHMAILPEATRAALAQDFD